MKKTAYLGILTALALVMSYVETFIPVPTFVPGIKLGLANIVILFMLYKFDSRNSLVISLIRVVLAGFMFGSMSSIIYGLSGAILSWLVMFVAKNRIGLSIITVSVCGAISHIIGQMLVAGAVTDYGAIVFYAPYLLLASFVSGLIIGMVTKVLVDRISIDME